MTIATNLGQTGASKEVYKHMTKKSLQLCPGLRQQCMRVYSDTLWNRGPRAGTGAFGGVWKPGEQDLHVLLKATTHSQTQTTVTALLSPKPDVDWPDPWTHIFSRVSRLPRTASFPLRERDGEQAWLPSCGPLCPELGPWGQARSPSRPVALAVLDHLWLPVIGRTTPWNKTGVRPREMTYKVVRAQTWDM